ncbi:MAG: DUF2189 domain-containing protein [Gammaproteobacteria bacterium]|nr:DUF2189 domain-containing protein [Gammaproteobacteria bacterium]
MNVQSYINQHISSRFSIHHVAMAKPFKWLSLAWQDFANNPKASLAHGLIVTALMLVTLLITSVHVYVIAAAITGFMLVGPILSAGLCELSRQNERGNLVGFDRSLEGLKPNQDSLLRFSSILLGFSVVWFVVSGLLLLITVGDVAPSLQQLLWGNILDIVTPMQLVLYTLVGGILASIIFVVSVVTVPTIIDNNVTALEAMALSAKVTFENMSTMLVWAGLIVTLIAIGFSTYLIGMIVIYPLLAHATFHAYRDLVKSNI